jgi:hypothetical protein
MSICILRLRRFGLPALLFAVSLCLGVFSLRASPSPEQKKLRDSLWEAQSAAILGGRQACAVLTSIRGPLQPDDPRLPAIELLGHLRFEEGAHPLVKQIEFSGGATDCAGNPRSIPEQFPAARALARIGRKGSQACARALAEAPTEQQKQLLMWVIHECENPVSAHAIFSDLAVSRDGSYVLNLVRARREYAAYEMARAKAAAAAHE